jgi:putative ABC transport system ATP-binding protein
MGDVKVQALQGISLSIAAGEFAAVMGASGSGKSTLMNIVGCLDYASEGAYYLDGVHVNTLNKRQLADIRNQKIGFVFQGFNLLSRTSALENVELPLLYDRRGRIKHPRQRAIEALERVALGDRLDHEPNRLSGGQQQRVAIARALANDPGLILADEPTGNLDPALSREILGVLQELNQRERRTIVMVTHSPEAARVGSQRLHLSDGQVASEVAD